MSWCNLENKSWCDMFATVWHDKEEEEEEEEGEKSSWPSHAVKESNTLKCSEKTLSGCKSDCIWSCLHQAACLHELPSLSLFQPKKGKWAASPFSERRPVHVDSVRTSVPTGPPVFSACPPWQLQRLTDLSTGNKSVDITLTLWDCPRPSFLPLCCCLCGLSSPLSLQLREARSITEIVVGCGRGIVRKLTCVWGIRNNTHSLLWCGDRN